MAEYSPSVATRQALIKAAGELFAEYGIEGVTTRDIARAANENSGLIHYHFKSKENLVEAVLDFATEPWNGDPMGSFLKENERLFESAKGQRKLVFGLVDLFIKTIFKKDMPLWCGMLVYQVFHRDIPASDWIYKKCAAPIIDAFHTVYERVTGDSDRTKSFCWMSMTISPMHFFSIDPSIARRIYHSKSIPETAIETLRKMTIRSSLVNIGLWDKALESELCITHRGDGRNYTQGEWI